MDENSRVCLMNLLLISVSVILSVQMIKSLNRFSFIESYLETNDRRPNSLPTNGQKVGKDTLGKLDTPFIAGTPTGLLPGKNRSMSNPDEDAPGDGLGNKTKVLFKNTPCAPEYCEFGKGTNYSCDVGCIKMEKAQNKLISSRGDGVYPNESSTKLSASSDCIIKDQWCKN